MQSIEQFTTRLVSGPPPGSRVRSHLTLPAAVPTLGPECSAHLPSWLSSMLQAQGIERLADYQWRTLHLVQQRQHVCLAAPAGAGRGVARLLALYQSLVTERQGHALCIFPQKLRELDQLKTLTIWNDHLPPEHRLSAAIYDGDTPKTQRRAIKQSPPHLVLTTPEMLHAGILAYHGGWRALFQNLRYIIFADLHLCAGALGAHFAHLWRRLYRLSRYYGAQPQYLITSAPLGNLHHVAHSLTGQPCTVVAGEAWRRQPQSRVLLAVHGDVATVTNELEARLSDANLHHLVLDPSSAERRHAPPSAYRMPHAALPQGVVFLGVPASLTRLHEYLARFANHPAPSVTILVLRGATPLERYLLRYAAVYQTHWMQDLPLNPNNSLIARQHLLCAAAELALEAGEQYAGIHGLHELIHQLASDKAIARRAASRQWVAIQRQPHRRVRLRSFEPGFAVVHQDNGHLLTTLSPEQAFQDAFEGAVYHHAEQFFHVERHFAERRRIVVRRTHAAYRTHGLVKTRIKQPSIEASTSSETCRIIYGTLCYAETLHAFERLDVRTQARTSRHALTGHHRQFHTQGVWIDFPDAGASHAAIHTLVHAVLAGLPLLLMGEGTPMKGGVHEPGTLGTAGPAAVFVDAQAGGNGASACLYRAHERALRIGLQILLHCDCERGCSHCVAGQRCDTCEETAELDRQAGIILLQRLLGELAPSLEAVVVKPPPRKDWAPRHIYLCLSTQKSAADVGGWQHKHLLGLGVAVTYDTQDERYRVYTTETVEALLSSLRAADLVVGFNLRDFDYQVLQPYAGTPLATLPTLAILDEVQHALGFRLSLSHLVRETLGIERPDDSILTPQWFQEGARDRIVDHCRRDVELLRKLVHHGVRTGTLCYRDRSGEPRTVPVDWQIVKRYG